MKSTDVEDAQKAARLQGGSKASQPYAQEAAAGTAVPSLAQLAHVLANTAPHLPQPAPRFPPYLYKLRPHMQDHGSADAQQAVHATRGVGQDGVPYPQGIGE